MKQKWTSPLIMSKVIPEHSKATFKLTLKSALDTAVTEWLNGATMLTET